jgi:hypothetical protein
MQRIGSALISKLRHYQRIYPAHSAHLVSLENGFHIQEQVQLGELLVGHIREEEGGSLVNESAGEWEWMGSGGGGLWMDTGRLAGVS